MRKKTLLIGMLVLSLSILVAGCTTEGATSTSDSGDECPNLPNEENEPCGDTTDSDGDGVNDIDDECPALKSEQHKPCGDTSSGGLQR